MTLFNRIFLALITAQVGLEVLISFLDFRATAIFWLSSLTFLLVFTAAYLAQRAGASLARATICALPFAFIMFAHGVLNFALGIGDQPADWSSTDEWHAFLGYVMATLMTAVALSLTAFLGALTSRALARRKRPDAV